MKINDLERVNTLVKIRLKCEKALSDMNVFESVTKEQGVDCGGTQGYDIGYNACISMHSDGSGVGADLSGCYIAVQLAEVTREILCEQINRVDADLVKLGVDMSVETNDGF